jgi:flagellar basal body P-ring protein FlgI
VYHQLSSAPAPAPAAPAAPAADRIYAHAEGGTVPCTNSDDGDNSDVSESVLRAAEERLGAEIRRRIEVAETATSMRFLNMK